MAQLLRYVPATALCLLLLVGHAQGGNDDPTFRAILMELYEATEGAQWVSNTGWGGPTSYCDWFGVTCVGNNSRSGAGEGEGEGVLTELDLWGNGLVGTIPDSLGGLSSLQNLYLHANALVGTIPASLGKLQQLVSEL
jgi:hypothetical protein